ncbi:unnamed protein product [Laminaria digitata]
MPRILAGLVFARPRLLFLYCRRKSLVGSVLNRHNCLRYEPINSVLILLCWFWVYVTLADAELVSPPLPPRVRATVTRFVAPIVGRGSVCGRQGTSGAHPRVSLVDMDLAAGYIGFLGNPGVYPGYPLTTTGLSRWKT